jgi:hypothetical protein
MFIALLGSILLAGCGGNGDTTSQSSFNNGSGDQPFKPTTHLSHRSVVTNYSSGVLQVMDTTQNRLTTYTFTVGSEPTYLQSSPDGTLTLVNNSGSNSLSSLNNNLEAIKATINLGGSTESFVSSISNKFGFAAVPNYSNGNPPILPGAIVRFNPTDGSLNTQIPFPYVHDLAMDTAEKHLLAFTSGDTQPVPAGVAAGVADDIANWVDLTSTDSTTGVPPYYPLSLSSVNGPVQLSRPVAAFFSADNTKAYVLSCGVECGGTGNANVAEIDLTSITPPASSATGTVVSANVLNVWAVNGARRGLIDTTANKLYVTGSTTLVTDGGGYTVQDGYFSVIDLTNTTAAPTSFRIGNGKKRWIRNIKGVYWVASLQCGASSCITLVNPTANPPVVALANARGDATGVSLAGNSGKVYTVEGGELYIYDQKGNPYTSTYPTDVKGQASDVLYID